MRRIDLKHADVTQPIQDKVAAVVVGHATGIRLARISPELRLGQTARQGRVGIDMGQVKPGGNAVSETPTQIDEQALVVLLGMLAIAVLFGMRQADKTVPVAKVLGQGRMQASITKTAALQAQVGWPGGLAGRGNEVDCATQVGRAIAPGIGAA